MDAIPPGFGADIDHRVADAGRRGEEDFVLGGDADGHGVDQRVTVIGRVEIHLPADSGHADAVAIAANAADHAVHHALGDGQGRVAEAQRVQVGDGAGTHGEHIAQDAADARGGTLIGLDEAGVVVGFHFENGGHALANVDDAGILAGAMDDPGGGGGEGFEPDSGGFVGAMLRPHDGEDAKLGEAGQAAHDGEDFGIFLGVEAEGFGEGGVDGFHERSL